MFTDAFTRASFVPAYSYWLPMNVFCVYIHVCCECIMIALYAYFFCPYLSLNPYNTQIVFEAKYRYVGHIFSHLILVF